VRDKSLRLGVNGGEFVLSANVPAALAVERQIQDLTDPPLEVCVLMPLREDI